MARGASVNSATSQWFINTQPNTALDVGPAGQEFTTFGRVIGNGMTVVDAIFARQITDLTNITGVGALTNTPLQNPLVPLTRSLTGTVSTSTGSNTVTGVGTRFTQELVASQSNPGGSRSRISIGGQTFNVQSITSDTQLVLDRAATQNNNAVASTTDGLVDNDFIRFTTIGEILN